MLVALDRFFSDLGHGWRRTLLFLLVCIIGLSDYWTGFALQFELFYLVPITAITWYVGKRDGQIAAALASVLSLTANLLNTDFRTDLRPLVLWNGLNSLLLFLLMVWLVAKLRNILENEQHLARTDHLTDCMNNHAFMPALQYHLDLAAREQNSITLAYLDVDNFKLINDTLGHGKGDRVLKQVAEIWRASSRRTDLIARMGGDEFCLLFPNTGQAAARHIIEHARQALNAAFAAETISVSCSVGVITFCAAQLTSDDAIRAADLLMYRVKKQGKNSALFAYFDASSMPRARTHSPRKSPTR